MTVVFPGAIATNITENSGVSANVSDADAVESSFPMISPEDAAATIVKGIERNQFQVYIGRDASMMNWLYRFNPKRATHFMFNQMKALLPD